MSGLINFGDLSGLGAAAGAIGDISKAVGGVIERIVPDPDLRIKLQHETDLALVNQATTLQTAISDAANKQIEVNMKEAESSSLFVAGWRPAAGWMCIVGIAFGSMFMPLATWVSAMFHGPAMPSVDTGVWMTLLMALLGLGGMRTYEKQQGVAMNSLQGPADIAAKAFKLFKK